MKYAKFDVQYLQDGTWHLNKRFDNLEDAEKRYEANAKNWLHWEGRMPTTAVRIRRVTIQETYETIRQTEPAIRPEVHLTEPGDYLVHIGDSEAAAASHYEHMVRRWLGVGGIKGVQLLKDGLTIRGTSTTLTEPSTPWDRKD